ncbi:MAG: hypothetical protein IT436_11410 [Phycisphaerales bacterium]|nr:hypothetical protein [Phycisphaerales bacterium]
MTHDSVLRWLETHTGIEPSLLAGPGVELLISERIAAFGGREPAYIKELAGSSDEVDRLVAAVAVPETWLFRYPRSYELLLEFLQRLLAGGTPALRMLSIGCAGGQEPYCMAMTALHAGWPADRIRIEAVDRNGELLRAASAAEYGASSIRTEIPAWAVAFLRRSGDAVAVDPAVRALVRFTRIDILAPGALRGAGPYDVIFCRNVLIYLNAVARERLLNSICAELSPGGLLFVGHAEQVMRGAAPLRPVPAPHAFALQTVSGLAAEAERPALDSRFPSIAPAHPRRAPAGPVTPPPASARPAPDQQPEGSVENARELADAGSIERAEAMIRSIIARRGPSAPALELLGMIRMSVNDADSAKRMFEQAVYLEPGRSGALLQLALISERSGDERRAASYWDRAQRASPSGRSEHSR